jgi:arsenate reductase
MGQEEYRMKLLFLHYPNCDTCRKAKKWLDAHDVEVEVRHIVEQPPTAEELRNWIPRSELAIEKFFNTSGQVYRNGGYKEKLKGASEEEILNWLAADGMLVKRPIVVGPEQVTLGFKEEAFEQQWGKRG